MVSVIIRTVNRIELLQKAIESVISQHYRPIELVIVNDSDIETPTFLLEFAKKDLDDVIYCHNTWTHGRSHAANMGLDNVHGDYVMFLDEDDLIYPHHIEKLIHALEANRTFSVAYSGICMKTDSGELIKNMDAVWEPARLRVINYLPIHAVLFKRSIAKECRFDCTLDLMEDWDFWLQLAAKSNFYYAEGVSGTYNISNGLSGISTNRDMEKVRKSHSAILKKWLPSFNEQDLSDSILWLDTAMDHYQMDAARLKNELETSRLDYREIQTVLDRTENENQRLKEGIDTLLKSKSWRVTRPLRITMKWVMLLKYALKNPSLIYRGMNEIRLLGFKKTLLKMENAFSKIEASADAHMQVLRVEDVFGMFLEKPFFYPLSVVAPIDILIPVYNGKEFLAPLFESIFAHTSLPYRLLVCDDKSSDVSVLPFLYEIQRTHPEVTMIVVENTHNLGFIQTVNTLAAMTQNHFVLLNTDTEVPPHWIERLMYPIFEMDNIASTTPFTNAGTICSFPNYLEDNKIFEGMSVDTIDRAFQYVNFDKTAIEIPTGVGFCMGVNRDVAIAIGMFDTVFGKGYGEENDWCQRALEHGYKNLHVTNLFVYHKHGGSFSSTEKDALIRTNLLTLNTKHPTYDAQVQHLIAQDDLKTLREMVVYFLQSSHTHTVVIFDHHLGGGANDYTQERVSKRITSGETICLIRYDFNATQSYIVELITPNNHIILKTKALSELSGLLNRIELNEVFVNSLVSYPDIPNIINLILSIRHRTLAKLIVPIHDFFPVCPSYTLLNSTMTYCGVPHNLSQCDECMKNNRGEFKLYQSESNIAHWREIWDKLFEVTDTVLCFSHSSKEIFGKGYAKHLSKVDVVLHDISGRYSNIYTQESKNNEMRIGILGGINEAKGASVVKNLVDYIDKHGLNAKVILIGQISVPISSDAFRATGRYTKDELPRIVADERITQFLIPSVWPETFSYTTDEIMQMGYPLIVFDLGAPAERVKEYPLGKVIAIEDLYEVLFGS